jgi:hypothetical protein
MVKRMPTVALFTRCAVGRDHRSEIVENPVAVRCLVAHGTLYRNGKRSSAQGETPARKGEMVRRAVIGRVV